MGQFPKYLMFVDGREQYMSFEEAVAAYDDDSSLVEFGRYVREKDGNVRRMEEVDQQRIIASSMEYNKRTSED